MTPFSQMPTRHKLWMRHDYDRMIDAGILGKDDHIELLNGEIVENPPPSPPHACVVVCLTHLLLPRFLEECHLRIGLPLSLSDRSIPEPDAALVRGDIRDYSLQHPQTAELVIEVADATLDTDRTDKVGIYAEARIADYWIINIKDRVVEVYREPAAISGTLLGYGYRSVRHYTEDEQISLLFAPETVLNIEDLLP